MSSKNQSNNSVSISGTTTAHFDYSNEPIMTIYSDQNIVVSLNRDGTVDWAHGYDNEQMEEAANAFCNALLFGGAQADGLEQAVRKNLVANVFERLIELTETHGPLSVEDIRNEQECYKMIARLKGTDI